MRSFFMSCVKGEDRGQAALLPAAIEDYVAVDAAELHMLAYSMTRVMSIMGVRPLMAAMRA